MFALVQTRTLERGCADSSLPRFARFVEEYKMPGAPEYISDKTDAYLYLIDINRRSQITDFYLNGGPGISGLYSKRFLNKLDKALTAHCERIVHKVQARSAGFALHSRAVSNCQGAGSDG